MLESMGLCLASVCLPCWILAAGAGPGGEPGEPTEDEGDKREHRSPDDEGKRLRKTKNASFHWLFWASCAPPELVLAEFGLEDDLVGKAARILEHSIHLSHSCRPQS